VNWTTLVDLAVLIFTVQAFQTTSWT